MSFSSPLSSHDIPHVCLFIFSLYVCVSLFTFSLSDTNHIRIGLTYPKVVSFYLDYLCKNLVSKYCYKHKYCGLVRTWTYFLGERHNSTHNINVPKCCINHCAIVTMFFFLTFSVFSSISMYFFYKLNNLNGIQKVR